MPRSAGRDQVMGIMRELDVQSVRRGRTPVMTKPARDTGGRPDLMDRKFEAGGLRSMFSAARGGDEMLDSLGVVIIARYSRE